MKKLLLIFVWVIFWGISQNAGAQDTLMQIHGQVYEKANYGIQNTRNSIEMERVGVVGIRDMRALRFSFNELFRNIFSRERAAELADKRINVSLIVPTQTAQIAEIRILSISRPYPLTAEETYRLEKALVGFQLDVHDYPEDAPPYAMLTYPLFLGRIYE